VITRLEYQKYQILSNNLYERLWTSAWYRPMSCESLALQKEHKLEKRALQHEEKHQQESKQNLQNTMTTEHGLPKPTAFEFIYSDDVNAKSRIRRHVMI
jgi:hypothetical protein